MDNHQPQAERAEHLELAQALKEFSAHAAHEISNPLNAIGLNAELSLTLMKLGRVAEAEEALKRLLRDCWQCGREVRSVARLGESLAEPAQPIHVAELLKDLTELIARRCERPVSQFVCEVPADLPKVRVSAYTVSHALDYLARRLITEAMQQMHFTAALEDCAVRVNIGVRHEAEPACASAKAPQGLNFFKRTLGTHGVRLACPADTSGAIAVWLPI